MSSKTIEEIKELYNKVFDENGNVTLCGRDASKKLMIALNEIYEAVDFGDLETGFLNVENVKKYVNKLIG